MNATLIKSVAAGTVVPTVGKYTKDGQDLDYVLTFQTFDPMTGKPKNPTNESVSRAWIESEIATREDELNDLQLLLTMLSDEGVTVIEDYTGQ